MSNDSTEQTIYGIPVSELSAQPERVMNGTYYNFKGYNLYVPDEVDASTAAFIYYPGSGGSGNDAKIIGNLIESGSANQIIVIADDAYRDKSTGGARHLQLIENIGAENGVEITNIDTMGFSAGGPSTYNTLINTIQNYPDSGPHSAVFCDVVDFQFQEEHINMLLEDESTLLYLEPNGTSINSAKKLAQAGVDVILGWTSGSHAGHVAMNKEALQNGIIDFVTGEYDEIANSDIYKFVSYDASSNQWVELSLQDVADRFAKSDVVANPYRYYERLSNMDTNLRCNNSFLGSKINTIRAAIKNSNFLSTTSLDYYSSTTQIPNAENEVVQAYFSSCAKMLNCLEKDTSKIIEIGNSIDEINDNLKKDAEDLNTSINYYTNNNTTNSLNGNSSNTSNNSWTSTQTQTSYTPTYGTSSPSSSSNSSNSGVSSGVVGTVGAISGGTSSTTDTETTLEEQINNINNEFLEYNDLCTDAEKKILVYRDTEKDCKVVVHYEGDKILTIEHYYQYPTRQTAADTMNSLKEEYGTTCTDVLRETNTVKVVMNESTYKDLTVTKLKEQYKEMESMVELLKESETNAS